MLFTRPAFKNRINEILTMTKMIRQYYELVEKKIDFHIISKLVLQLKFFVQYKLERHWNTIFIWFSPFDNYMNTKKRIQSNRIKLVFMMITFLSILIINHKCFLLIQTTKWSVLIVVKTITDNKTMWYGTFKYTLPIWMIFILAQFVRHQQKMWPFSIFFHCCFVF